MEEIKKVKYDFVVIYRDNENLEEMKKLIMQKIKDYNYEINEMEEWGTRLLAYPIKKQNKGYYVLYNLIDREEDTKIKTSDFAKEIEKLQYEEDKILKFVLVRL
ncbi:MAG: 30S ribosomal protein S6 [Methanobrevibacter sp.]|nr:30S ribosomal protein S6 [Methanobrevibacter sp.]